MLKKASLVSAKEEIFLLEERSRELITFQSAQAYQVSVTCYLGLKLSAGSGEVGLGFFLTLGVSRSRQLLLGLLGSCGGLP